MELLERLKRNEFAAVLGTEVDDRARRLSPAILRQGHWTTVPVRNLRQKSPTSGRLTRRLDSGDGELEAGVVDEQGVVGEDAGEHVGSYTGNAQVMKVQGIALLLKRLKQESP